MEPRLSAETLAGLREQALYRAKGVGSIGRISRSPSAARNHRQALSPREIPCTAESRLFGKPHTRLNRQGAGLLPGLRQREKLPSRPPTRGCASMRTVSSNE